MKTDEAVKSLIKRYEELDSLCQDKPEDWFDIDTYNENLLRRAEIARILTSLGYNEFEEGLLTNTDYLYNKLRDEPVKYKIVLKIDREDGRQIDFSHYSTHTVWSGETYSGESLSEISSAIEDIITGLVHTKEGRTKTIL